MKTEQLADAFLKYGTPLYVYDLDRLRADTREIREQLAGDSYSLCYSIKANPFLTREMGELCERLEVCSYGEFLICRDLKIAPEHILFSGVSKKAGDLHEMIDYSEGKSLFSIESLTQYSLLSSEASERKRKIRVLLRLTSGNQFGMDEKEIESIVGLRELNPLIEIEGIHYFSGTQKKKADQIRKELEALDAFLMKSRAEGFEYHELEYGTGLEVPYFPDTEKERDPETLRMISSWASHMKWKGGITFEMGRAFAAGCGVYLTEVLDLKESCGKHYCIVDGGSHQLHYDGQIRGMYTPEFRILPDCEEGERRDFTVCGSLCTGNDILIQKVSLCGLKEHDIMAFGRVGAYSVSEGMALFLSHELPAVVFYSEQDGFRQVRHKTETYRWNMDGKEE